MRVAVLMVVALAFSTGCALFGKDEAVPPGFERIALRSEVALDERGQLEGDLRGDSAIKGATLGLGLGAISGAGVGFAVGSIACVGTAAAGPLIIIAYPFCVAGAVGIGFVVGGMSGSVVGASTGLPWKTAGEVDRALLRLQEGRDFAGEFGQAVTAAVSPDAVDEPRAQAIVTARLDEFDLRQHLRQRLSVRLKATLLQTWDGNGDGAKRRTCTYTFTSSTHEVEDWLLHDGQLFADTLTDGMDTLGLWMARDLEAFATRQPAAETSDAPATCFQPAN